MFDEVALGFYYFRECQPYQLSKACLQAVIGPSGLGMGGHGCGDIKCFVAGLILDTRASLASQRGSKLKI